VHTGELRIRTPSHKWHIKPLSEHSIDSSNYNSNCVDICSSVT